MARRKRPIVKRRKPSAGPAKRSDAERPHPQGATHRPSARGVAPPEESSQANPVGSRTYQKEGAPSFLSARSKPNHRNVWLDAIRGLAVVLMLVDHAAAAFFDARIELGGIRFVTRLSMPLFCVLMGFLLPPSPRWWPPHFKFRRYAEILLACAAVNVIHWPQHHELEVLASLLIATVVAAVLGPFAPAMLIAFFAYQVDPIATWFDYQLSLVLPLVAQGIILRRYGWWPAISIGVVLTLMTVSGQWIFPSDTHRFIVWFLIPAISLVHIASRVCPMSDADPTRRQTPEHKSPQRAADSKPSSPWGTNTNGVAHSKLVQGLGCLGRYPLTIYVAHFLLIAVVAELLQSSHH